MITFILQKVLN